MLYGSISHWRNKLKSGEITPTELVQELAKVATDKNPSVNAYISWNTEAALQAAAKADISLPLGGIPIAIKDNICLQGEPTRCASQMLHNFISPYDATAVARLKAAGAIPFGRANMDEFAMGSAGENSAFGHTENPSAPGHTPGGSSSGSAAAVAAGMAIAALGSDTGGSIRQPASHCGIVGLKPTYGRISRYGLVAFASSLDQIGPITQNVSDAALLLNTLCGHDAKDSTSAPRDTEDFTRNIGQSIAGKRIGLPKEYLSSGNSPEVTAALQLAIAKLTDMGAEIVEISLPHSEAVVSAYYIIACAEASSNLSRFDGIRYGYRADNTNGLDDLYSKSRAQGFGAEVKRRIILGTYVLSSGFYDAYYAKAQKVRALVAKDFADAFTQVDFILGPVAPTAAPKLHNTAQSPLQVYLADIYTIPANLAGLPGISIPVPQNGGLPIGVQLLGQHFAEADLLQVAAALESSLA
ncbi:MAG: Asp-tRNA(Asn)/Glu-tRNA(Gln) amidotransferase subunit GatA [Akkermansiaceae bacterium]|nr:Asp-tRNA(Asn)/Glu-tRNA(Gln) amidotransferase subunit GatA [Akkermansiaceae bacterium]